MHFDGALFIAGMSLLMTWAVYSVTQLSSSTCETAVWSGPCSFPSTTWLLSCCQGSRSDRTLGCGVGVRACGSVQSQIDFSTWGPQIYFFLVWAINLG